MSIKKIIIASAVALLSFAGVQQAEAQTVTRSHHVTTRHGRSTVRHHSSHTRRVVHSRHPRTRHTRVVRTRNHHRRHGATVIVR